jgi:hypothetical protein
MLCSRAPARDRLAFGPPVRLPILIVAVCAGLLFSAGSALADGGPIMPLSDVRAGMDCTGETVVSGTTITSFDVHVISIVQAPGEGPRILVSVSGPAVDSTGVAEGFSGSPVYCPDGLGGQGNIGAIAEGIGQFGNAVVLVTPIEQMLGAPVTPPASAPRLASKPHPLLGPLTVGGLSPAVFGVLQRAAAQAGRVVIAAPSPGATALAFPVQSLVPGASVAASYSSGAIPVGAIGTVTYVNGQTVYAFGHELDGAGRRSLLLQDGYVYYVVNNPEPNTAPSYKLASPGHTLGTITSDTPAAVIGQLGSPPPSVPVDVVVRDLDSAHSLALDTQVADETDVGLPLGASLVDAIAPLEVAQAATQIYDGPPANQSGRMCLRIYLRETRTPLGFCNRYVGTGEPGDALAPPELANAASTDVTNAFAALEQVDFAALHLKRVVARLDAQRGLAEASILDARAPRRVRPGQEVRVRLGVRVYRGGLRTFGFRVRIPRGASGPIALTIKGPPVVPGTGTSSQGLTGALTTVLSFGSTSQPLSIGPISSLSELREAIAGLASYDGLYASFSGRGKRPVYRNQSLLITGQARLRFVVAG